MRRASVIAMIGLVAAGSLAACSDSGGSDDSPTLDRIDGPAQVDPSYDPFATAPPVTEADG